MTEETGSRTNADVLIRCAEVASALAEVAESTTVRREIAVALEVEGVAPGDLYELFVKELPPFASIYLSEDGNIGGDCQGAIAGFYRAIDSSVPSDPDHISALLTLLSQILTAEAQAEGLLGVWPAPGDGARSRYISIRHTRQVLLEEHLLTWFPAYLIKAEQAAPPALRGWVNYSFDLLRILSQDLSFERRIQLEPDPGPLEGERLLDWLTAPFRSGIIITHLDIARISAAIDIPLRVGRKRFILQGLWQSDSSGVLEQLSKLCEESVNAYAKNTVDFGCLERWREKSEFSKTMTLEQINARPL